MESNNTWILALTGAPLMKCSADLDVCDNSYLRIQKNMVKMQA